MIEKIFARIENGVVVNTAVSIDSEINLKWFVESLGGDWVEADTSDEVSVGWVYSEQVGKFIPPKPGDNFELDETTCLWVEVEA